MGAGKGFAWKRATGVLHTDDRLLITRLAITALGQREMETEELLLSEFADSPAPLTAALRHLSQEQRLRGQIVVGIDPRGMYAVTRQITETDKELSAAELVAAQLGAMEGGLAAAMSPAKLHGGTFRVMIAASKSRARALLAGLDGFKGHHIQLPSMPQVLLRMAMHAAKRPRKWQTLLRVLPGPSYGMAMLSVGDMMIAWRMFAPGRNGRLTQAAVEPALLGMLDHAKKDLLIERIDGCLVQVGRDAEEYQRLAEDLAADLDMPVQLAGEANTETAAICTALANWGLQAPPNELDLFEGLQPRLGLLENFPRKAAAGLLATLAGCGFLLWNEATDLENQAALVTAKAKQDAKRAMVKLSSLKKQHEVLANEFRVAKSFIGTRVFFEDFLRELPSLLPGPMRITRIEGYDAVSLSDKVAPGAKKTKLQITTEMDAPSEAGTPPEVAAFTAGLRSSPAFRESFPRITGASIRLQKIQGGQSRAKMVIVCMPGQG